MTPAQRGAEDVRRGKARAAKVLAAKKKPAAPPAQEQFLEEMSMNDVIIRDIRNVFQQVGKLGEWVGEIDRRTRAFDTRDTGGPCEPSKVDPSGSMHTSSGSTRPMAVKSGLNRLEDVRKSSPIFDALDEIQCQGNLLHETISRLEDKLSPVIAPRPTTANGEAGERAGGSTVMGILHDRILMVRGARHRIEALLESLEV